MEVRLGSWVVAAEVVGTAGEVGAVELAGGAAERAPEEDSVCHGRARVS